MAVKGMEGSCDLARSRTAIVGIHPDTAAPNAPVERLLLPPRDYGFEGDDVPMDDEAALGKTLLSVLAGEPSELFKTAQWNAGFYLWQGGAAESLEAGLALAHDLLTQGHAMAKLAELRQRIAALSSIPAA
jgi:anthranilate phosphoribosyltransferase